MKFTTLISTLFLAGSALAIRVSYDNTYDDPSGSMDSVACSDGPTGLAANYSTFGDLPSFPFIGGSSAISGWSSPSCGNCFSLSYGGNIIYVTPIDHTQEGFNLAQEAMDVLTGGKAEELGISIRAFGSLCFVLFCKPHFVLDFLSFF
ncbi:cerato-platanin [Pyrrhoderma noxium]|uniref:Cerato-platanin n=1 Tax=Pyrrhoderma noxium TaxID=2282107 RepID=A0A286UK19_9AGAM|nr:cerato-platanin [Pyrrhoderma noxium]